MLTEDDLREYQLRAIDWIETRDSCALWVDMGLGKTVSALTATIRLINSFDVDKTLVIAPLRVARKTWSDEVETWAHTQGLKVSLIIGPADKRLAAINADADIYCINNENVTWLVDQFVKEKKLLRKWKWDQIIIDESSSFKTHTSNRFKALRKIRKFVDRVVELTGTPSPNGLMNLWSQVFLLDRGERLGKTITAFRNRWFDPPGYNQFKWSPKPFAEKEIMERLSDICLALREEDYLELPDVMYNFIRAEITAAERKEYKTFEKNSVLEINGETITAVNAGVLAGKLLQCANGAIYTARPAWESFHESKTKVLLELLETLPGPTIICYNFQSDLERLREAMTKAKLNWDVLTDTKSEDRWNAGSTDVLVMHPKSAGHGLNLHHSGSEALIWYGLNWDLELYQQANARLIGGHRRKDRNVVIHHIVTPGTIDDDVMDILKSKEATQARMISSMVKRISSLHL